MTATVPFIPENAPFSAEQRAWLNGFLAGMFSTASAAQREPMRGNQRVAVLYASQSGTAEGLARKLAKELKAAGYNPSLSTLVGYTSAALASESRALILVSTYGDGDAPDGVQPFYEQLCLEHFPRMENLSYCLLALGDRHYEHFCKFGADLDAKLMQLGANQILKRVDCDVDVDEPFTEWKEAVLLRLKDPEQVARKRNARVAAAALSAAAPGSEPALRSENETSKVYSRENPLLAPLVEKRRLTHPSSTKVTLHLAFSTAGTGLSYQAGDAFGVIPKNNPNLVAEILQLLGMNGNEQVPGSKGETTTLHDALSCQRQITRLNRKLVQEYAKRSGCGKLLNLLAPEQQTQMEQYVYDRGLVDLLVECPGVIDDPEELVKLLPCLTPRLYSISSSPLAHAGELHATVAVVRYSAHNRERGGVCSTLFADRTEVSDRLPIYIQPNKKFKLPKDPDAPMVMIGPGTGIAPFRGFLHERRALQHKGRNWLFFGERSSATDFLYREELEQMHADGHLTRFDTAFSRDQKEKSYVQNRMKEHSSELWKWMEDGAHMYVCGDAKQMAKDVQTSLCAIVEREGGKTAEQAQEYIASLKDQHRYHRDVY